MVHLGIYGAVLLSILAVLALFRGLYLLLMSDAALQVDMRLLPKSSIAALRQRESRLQPKKKRWVALVERLSITRSLDVQLEKANVRFTAVEWLSLWISIIAVSALLGYMISGSVLGLAAMAGTGGVLPRVWLSRRIEKRYQAFNEQLTDVMRLITNSLQAGHGMLQAINLVAKEMPPPASEEFERVVREVALGYSMNESLQRLAKRMRSDDLDMIVTAINIQAEVGGSLSEILRNISRTIEERVRLRGEVNALTAQQRMSGYLISGMPFILAVIISVLNPGYLTPLFLPEWRWLPVLGVVMMVIGQIAMRRAMEIDL